MNEKQAKSHGHYGAVVHYVSDNEDLYFRADCCEDDQHAIEQTVNYVEGFGQSVEFAEVIKRYI